MTGPPGASGSPGSIEDEAAQLAGAALNWLHRITAGRLPEPSPAQAARLTEAVTDFAVAGAGLARVLAEVAATAARRPDAAGGDAEPAGEPRVEKIDIS